MYQRMNILMIVLLLVAGGPGGSAATSHTSTSTQLPIGWVTLETVHSPDPRTGHAMAMLPDGRVLLFGGQNADGNVLGDTWIFGPEAIAKSAAPEDGVRPALHVGFDNRPSTFGRSLATFPRPHLLSPAHILNPEDWTPITPPDSPSPRQGHSMVTLPDGRVMLFGGVDAQDKLFNDLHSFEANLWSPVTPANDPPPGRFGHIAWGWSDKMYVQGGLKPIQGGNLLYEDMWRYDLLSNTWQQLANPPGFISPDAYPMVITSTVYLVDANQFPYTEGTVQSYDMNQDRWEDPRQTIGWPPFKLSGYMMVQADEKAYMLGGGIWGDTKTPNYTAQVWVLDLTTLTWTQLEDMPYPIYNGNAVYDPLQKCIIVWGGKQSESVIFPGNKTLIYYVEQSPVEQFPNSDIPSEFKLMQNYPNPFNPQTTIEYQLPKLSRVSLKVFDVTGCEILTLVQGEQPQGHYKINFDSHNLTSGTYFYILQTDGQMLCKRMLILK